MTASRSGFMFKKEKDGDKNFQFYKLHFLNEKVVKIPSFRHSVTLSVAELSPSLRSLEF